MEGINGRLNPDGLTVPLLGTHEDAIQLHVKQTEEATLVRLDIEDNEGPNLVRNCRFQPGPPQRSPQISATDASRFAGERLSVAGWMDLSDFTADSVQSLQSNILVL